MQDNFEFENVQENAPATLSRRTLLGRVAATGFGLAALQLVPKQLVPTQLMPSARAAMKPMQPAADTGKSYPMPKPNAKNERQFRQGVIGPAMLSLAASQLAVDKTSSPAAKEFANFELREAIGVTTVLKEMKTPVPPMNAMARATLAKLKATPKGAEFDKIYMTAQLANHEFLRDLADSYLKNSAGYKSMKEMHGRHLATLALGAFKEHVVHCKNFLQMM